MKPYVVKNTEFLKFFPKLRPENRNRLISTLDRNQINTISEVCKNFLNKNLTTCPKIIRKLKPSQKEIKTIALKKNPPL